MGKDSMPVGKAGGTDPATMLDSASKWRKGLIVTVFLVLVICILMPELVFQGNIFLVPDTKAPISFREAGRQELEKGTYPLWNPYIFGGMPSFQSLSYTPYVYPVAFLTYTLQEYLRFPEMTWLLLHYLMAGIGVYLLLRSFEVRSSVALLGGAIFMMMPNFLAHGANGHGSQACAIAYMPFALLFARNILAGKSRLLNGGLLAVALGFQTLRGHIQISYYTYLMVGLLVIFHVVYMIRSGRGRQLAVDLSFLAGAVVVSLGIASILILPVREYADYSIRGGGSGGGLDYDYATGWSLHPGEMATFVFPWAAGYGKATYWGKMPFTDYPNYLGIVTVLFSVISLSLSRNRWKWFILTLAVLSTFISFGRHFPALYDPLFRFLPYFNKFRVPVMILIVQQLVFVLLAGMGMEEYLTRREADTLPALLRGDRVKWLLIAAAAALIIVLVASGAIQDSLLQNEAVRGRVRPQFAKLAASAYSNDMVRTLFMLAASLFVLFLAAWKRLRPGTIVLALAVIALFDMFTVAQPVLRPEKGWNNDGYRIIRPVTAREQYKEENRAVDFLSQDDSYYRVFPVPYARPGTWSHNAYPFSDNSYMMSGIFSMGGYHAAKLKNYQEVMDVMFAAFNSGRIPKQILDMMGAKYFISLQQLSWERFGYEPVNEEEGNFIYLNPGALPRVFFVDRAKVLSRREALANLLSPSFEPAKEVLMESVPEGEIVSADGSSASISEYRPNSIKIDAHVEESCIMVLSEIYYPDWKAEVDGEEVAVFEVDCCLRGIIIGPGDHEVVYTFDSPVMKRALVISIVSLALSLLAIAGARFVPFGKVG